MSHAMEETNESLQADEIQALSAIYENEWMTENADQKVYSIKLSKSITNSVSLQVTLPESYPMHSPPIYQLSAPWMSRDTKQSLCSALEDVYCQNIGRGILYLWIETIKSFIEDSSNNDIEKSTEIKDEICEDERECFLFQQEAFLDASKADEETLNELPPIEHGEPIIDRKSVFQAHVARVVTVHQVNQVLQKLKENRKIASATHNILAYRIAKGDSKMYIQDCDDDGETKAGSGLLHLLQIVDVCDILVVVSRWYGGIHLGPDRFKHINNAARSLLCKLGYISEKMQLVYFHWVQNLSKSSLIHHHIGALRTKMVLFEHPVSST